MKSKKIQHFSRFTDKGTNIAERVITTTKNLMKKPIFLKGNADWFSELPSVLTPYNTTIHSSTKLKPIDASKKSNEKMLFNNLKDRRQKHIPKIILGQLVRTADVKSVLAREIQRSGH